MSNYNPKYYSKRKADAAKKARVCIRKECNKPNLSPYKRVETCSRSCGALWKSEKEAKAKVAKAKVAKAGEVDKFPSLMRWFLYGRTYKQ